MALRILRLENIGTLSSVFTEKGMNQRTPQNVLGSSIALMDYFADCESSGNPTLIEFPISYTFRNAETGSNLTLSVRWTPPSKRYIPAALPRFALIGKLERMSKEDVDEIDPVSCYGKLHPEARLWMPGNDIHESHWARLVIEEIYWFGGFGDRSYIGWIPKDVWLSVKEEEIEECRLPGEV